MAGRLDGLVAIVTGAAGGIGAGIAEMFCGEGARVMLSDINAEPLEQMAKRIGSGCSSFAADVSQCTNVAALIRFTSSHFGPPTVLVNNAAAYAGDGTLLGVSEETWDHVLAVNLKGPWLCMREVVPAMRAAGGGSIVNIGSVNGSFGLNLTAYSASKGGLAALTRIAAIELGPANIRVNTICPGTIMTPNSAKVYAERPGLEEAVTAMYPLGRVGAIEDIAYCAVYLASKESRFVTGSTVAVDGGLTAGRTFDLNYAKESQAG